MELAVWSIFVHYLFCKPGKANFIRANVVIGVTSNFYYSYTNITNSSTQPIHNVRLIVATYSHAQQLEYDLSYVLHAAFLRTYVSFSQHWVMDEFSAILHAILLHWIQQEPYFSKQYCHSS